jgi:hypothetical protein
MAFERITINPKQMGGLPCIRGLRIPVTTVIGLLAAGQTHEEIWRTSPISRKPTSTRRSRTRRLRCRSVSFPAVAGG